MSVRAKSRNEGGVHKASIFQDRVQKNVCKGAGPVKAHRRKSLSLNSPDEQSQTRRRAIQSLSDAGIPQKHGANYSFDGTIGGQAQTHFGDNIHNHFYEDAPGRAISEAQERELQLQYQHLLSSLTFPRMGTRERIVSDASPTTCEWLFNHQDFRAWIDDSKIAEHCGFLWIKGKPGVGKSTIMKRAKSVVDHMWTDQIVLSYFFNARSSDPLEKSTLGLWRSLVHQLLIADIESRDSFLSAFNSKISRAQPGTLGPVEPWEEPELHNWVADNIYRRQSDHPKPLTIFIDALDEGHDDEVLRLVSFLEEIASRAALTNRRLRICLSSRHYPHIHIGRGLSLVVENQQGHSHDIEIYVANHLRGTSSEEMHDLRLQLVQRSQGIFLWVVLVTPLLNRIFSCGKGVSAMARKLQELPRDIHDLFAALLCRDPEGIDEVATLLHWILYTLEPITPEMLQIAIAQTHQSAHIDSDPTIDPGDVELYLINCSRGLVEAVQSEAGGFSRSTLLVQFIHQSVRDFLTGTYQHATDTSSPAIQQADICHADIAKACLQYLIRLCATVPQQIRANTLLKWRLAPYAAKYWWQHMRLSGDACDPKLRALASQFLREDRYVVLWLQLYNIDLPTSVMTAETHKWTRYLDSSLTTRHLRGPLYYGVATGLFHLLPQDFPGYTFNIDAPISEGETPLQVAARRGYLETSKELLNAGADPNAGNVSQLALPVASEMGHDKIVAALLHAGADVNPWCWSPDYDHHPLHRASRGGHEKIVQMLIDAGADVNAQRSAGMTPLMSATEKGRGGVVKILLARGADPTLKSSKYGTAMDLAFAYCDNEIQRLLITHLPSRDHLGESLMRAANYGNVEIVRFLLEHGADVNYRSKENHIADTPLLLAIYNCRLSTVRILLDAKADADSLEIRDVMRLSYRNDKKSMEDFLQQNGLLRSD